MGLVTFALIVVLIVTAGAMAYALGRPSSPPGSQSERDGAVAPAATCATKVRVVTAASFAPVLTKLAPGLASGKDCARLEVRVADGRPAAQRIDALDPDVWIPDDPAWAVIAGGEFGEHISADHQAGKQKSTGHVHGDAGSVIATSPLYFVTDRGTASTLAGAGTSWLGLSKLVTAKSGLRPVLRDPAGSGDGLIAAGAVGEAVWLTSGMDQSALALADVVPASRTVTRAGAALPRAEREVGLVPEYVLVRQARPDDQVVLAPGDHTAQLRYTWLPAKAQDQKTAKATARLLRTLRGTEAGQPLAAAGLRGPDGSPPAGLETSRLPRLTAKPFDVLEPHHVDHVFTTWYAADRRSDVLLVVDVSGSMGADAPGTSTPLIRLVAGGCARLGALLPDDSRLELWEFGSNLDPPRDHRALLPRGALTAAHRRALGTATGALAARRTGTGLYDTVLDAYLAARNSYRRGTPNQVVLFTDGRNEDDPGSITAQQLSSALRKANDPRRPVLLSVVTFGPEQRKDELEQILKPVDGYVEELASASQVDATFIHVAAGGLVH